MASYGYETTAAEVAADFKSHIAGKTILLTGASPKGLGAVFATTIAQHDPACIILAGRDVSKGEETGRAIQEVNPDVRIRNVELDLASLGQVRKAVEQIRSLDEKIDIIVNNAAIMASPYFKTVDGIEGTFAINYLSGFLLTNLLLPDLLARNVPIRIVNVSSDGCRFSPVRFDDLGFSEGETYNRWISYAQSKSALMLYTKSLANKLGHRQLLAVSLHPGVILDTGLSRYMAEGEVKEISDLDKIQGRPNFWGGKEFKTPPQGAATYVFAAFSPTLGRSNGAYLLDSQVADMKDFYCWTRDDFDADRLWALSEELVGQRFLFE